MDQATHNKIVSFIWGIADDVLRDLFKRGKYPDVILPMCVLRRMDAVLEPTKKAVLETKEMLDKAGITEQRAALAAAAGQSFYNTSKFTLRDLKSRGSQQQLLADFEDYLNGFSQNVQDILENFKFHNQLSTLSKSDSLSTLIGKFLDPEINLSPAPVLNADHTVKHPGLDNHSMGTVFEELVRKFNEENNEEAGEHWTPRDAVRLMANLIFLPVADRIKSGAYLLYDGAAGTGGMLTVAEETLRQLATARGQQITTHLYAQEINPETYAICKADMLLKGEGESADHIVGGAEWSTLSHDAFPAMAFDFMMSNPPYGKSWKKDLENMGGKDGLRDPRFKVVHQGEELSLVTRSSDGQMLFLANLASKMSHDTPLGSRIAEVHNGSSLFTGDAGQGESNIRRWLIENDWLEAIVALPLNLFYNTGIATYIWVLTNRKPEPRRGMVQLIDATQSFKPLRKNLGKKNCELAPEDIQRICDTYLAFEETPQSKIFPNAAFGYWKVTVERPLRLHSQLTVKAIQSLRFASGDEDLRAKLYDEFGEPPFENFASLADALQQRLAEWSESGESDPSDPSDDAPTKTLPERTKRRLLDPATWERDARLVETATALRQQLGGDLFADHNDFRDRVDKALQKLDIKLSAPDLKLILRAVSWRVETAPPVIDKLLKEAPDALHGRYPLSVLGQSENENRKTKIQSVSFEPDPDLRDTEQIPFLEAPPSGHPGGLPSDPSAVASAKVEASAKEGTEAFVRREVLPYTPDAWIKAGATKVGYEISFTRHFYQPQPLRTLQEIRADILAVEKEAEGLLDELLKGGPK